MIERYEAEAQKNFDNYQATGYSRYERAQHKAEDLADSLRAALEAIPTRQKLNYLKAELLFLASKAERAKEPHEYEAVVEELLSFARMNGFASKEVSEDE